ncbi:hypothetical protein [Sphingomonas sp. PAMC 26605]|uniref:hypothetical protein n=1 Tax=Sphingomonas sp. PAMC 26605 TaxID=1112214 RepID=UPI00026CAC3F|nr:hypothetical protein [Sphingomonas sp. PAMC 26605]
MIDLTSLRTFIAGLNGDKAEISKASLVAIERELTAARTAAAHAGANRGILGVVDELLAPRDAAAA